MVKLMSFYDTCLPFLFLVVVFQSCSSAFLLRLVGSVHLEPLRHVLFCETEENFFSEKNILQKIISSISQKNYSLCFGADFKQELRGTNYPSEYSQMRGSSAAMLICLLKNTLTPPLKYFH